MTKIIDHHPIRFNHSTECNFINPNWHQFAQYGDTTQWQMGLDPCASDQDAIENGGFTSTSDWTAGTNWTIITSTGRAVKLLGSSGDLTQPITSDDGILWRIRIDIEVTSGPFAVVFGAFVTYITESGSYEFWAGSLGVTEIGISGDGTSSGYISNVSAVPVNQDFKAWLVDANGVDAHSFTSADFTYIDGWLTHSIDWEDLAVSAGCYTLEVSDPCVCAQGGIIAQDFNTNSDTWQSGTGWTVNNGGAAFSVGATSTGATSVIANVCEDVGYTVEYTLAITGTCDVYVDIGGTAGTTRTTSGTYSESITAGADNYVEFYASSTGAAVASITDFTIVRTKRTRDYVSVPIKVSEVDIDCTYRINVCCDADNMGAGFLNTGFTPSVRMKGQYAQGGMSADRNSYEFSTGKKSTTYYRGRKNKSLKLMCPSYMHDFLMHLGGYDHTYIDGEEVFVEDDEYPTVGWNDQTDLGTVTLTMREKEVLIENRRITSAAKGCDPNGDAILLNNDNWLDPATGEIITTG